METALSKDGTTIAFDRAGAGPALILVDGALCSRAFGPMPKLAALLSPHFTVYNYDRRGRGDSGDTPPYAVAREVEDLGALIQKAGGTAFVFGASSGGALALEAAASGLHISKLAMYEPPFVAEDKRGEPQPDHLAQLKRLVSAGRRGDAVKYFMRDMVNVPAVAVFIMQWMPLWSKLKAVAHTLPHDSALMGDWSVPRQRAASVRVPTLVMDGEKTDPRLRHAVEATAALVPNSERRTLKGQTHNASASVLAPELVEFFASTAEIAPHRLSEAANLSAAK